MSFRVENSDIVNSVCRTLYYADQVFYVLSVKKLRDRDNSLTMAVAYEECKRALMTGLVDCPYSEYR